MYFIFNIPYWHCDQQRCRHPSDIHGGSWSLCHFQSSFWAFSHWFCLELDNPGSLGTPRPGSHQAFPAATAKNVLLCWWGRNEGGQGFHRATSASRSFQLQMHPWGSQVLLSMFQELKKCCFWGEKNPWNNQVFNMKNETSRRGQGGISSKPARLQEGGWECWFFKSWQLKLNIPVLNISKES